MEEIIDEYRPNMKKNLFEEFEPSSQQDWIEQAIKDLRGKDFQQTLISKTFDGIEIKPFYGISDVPVFEPIKSFQNKINSKPEIPGINPRIWSNVFKLPFGGDDKSGNKLILDALMNGCDALLLEVDENTDFEKLLQHVEIPFIQVFLKPTLSADLIAIWKNFELWFNEGGWEKAKLSGGMTWDVMASLFAKNEAIEKRLEMTKELIEHSAKFPDFFPLAIDFTVYHEAGGTTLQELTFGFGAYIELVDQLAKKGLKSSELIQNTFILLSAGAEYFEQISKIRAARIFFTRLTALYGVQLKPEDIRIFCQSSSWTKSKMDVYSNLLRNTTEAMAAILGGCNCLNIKPHDEVMNRPNAFSLRMARNVSNILKEESYFDKVVDPVAGSYFIESLTMEILNHLKTELELLENSGGWLRSYQNRAIQNTVKDSRIRKQEMLFNSEIVKIGVNKYLIPDEDVRLSDEERTKELDWQLLASRESILLEKERLKKA